MADDPKVMEWADYLTPSCGRYRFARAKYEKHYPCVESKRKEYAKAGGLPDECVDSWKACRAHRDEMKSKCEEERKTFMIDTAQYIASGLRMPTPVPTLSKAGWVYPASWKPYLGAPGAVTRPNVGGANEARIDTSITNVPTTSNRTIAIGLGVGLGLVVIGFWLAGRK